MIQAYTSRTGSGQTLASLWEHGWRLLVNAYGAHRCEGFGYAIDCGTVQEDKERQTVRQRPDWDPGRFAAVLAKLGRGADWIVAPDIVAGGLPSLHRSERWLPLVAEYALPLIAVQDGMETADVWPLVGPRCGIFVGGSRAWKWSTLPSWGSLARERGCYLHVGRVNGDKRIRLADELGAHSFDGRCAHYVKHIPMLTRAAAAESTGQMGIHEVVE